MSPLERLEDKHNFTWGALGFNLLDAARQRGEELLESSLKSIAARINSREKSQGSLAATVFNPLGHDRTDVATTGKIYPLPANTRDVLVKDRTGRTVPSQIVQADRDPEGNLVMAELAFPASQVPSAGYDTYYLEPVADPQPPEKTSLVAEESKFILENEFLRVTLDSTTGAVASLLHKPSGARRSTAGARRFRDLRASRFRICPIVRRRPRSTTAPCRTGAAAARGHRSFRHSRIA